jgi:hypothetical protein
MALSAYEKERLIHINYKMNVMYDRLGSIYEQLVDRDFDDLKISTDDLIEELREIQISVTDET